MILVFLKNSGVYETNGIIIVDSDPDNKYGDIHKGEKYYIGFPFLDDVLRASKLLSLQRANSLLASVGDIVFDRQMLRLDKDSDYAQSE